VGVSDNGCEEVKETTNNMETIYSSMARGSDILLGRTAGDLVLGVNVRYVVYPKQGSILRRRSAREKSRYFKQRE